MSRSKRHAESDLEDDAASFDSSLQESSSQIGSDGRKRRRISPDSDTTPEHDPTARAQSNNDYLSENDVESEDDEIEEAATQAVNEKRAKERDSGNVARDYGILEYVIVHDFMCHHYLKYDLGPLINFITGKNGAGKSAILTAIVLCLGGRIGATNRAKSLKATIKEGADRARVIVRIKNQGPLAYMHDEYGDHIDVERHWTRSGTSGYEIRSTSGRRVSSKRSELDNILDHCNLQIDNPLNILSQDEARHFLQKSSPSEKYKFFLKGVQLQQLDEDYRLIEDRVQHINSRLEGKREDVGTLKEVMEQKRQNRELAKKRDGLRTKMNDLRRQIMWFQVGEREQVVKGFDTDIAKADTDIAAAKLDVDRLDAQLQNAVALHEASNVKLTDAQTALDAAKDEKKELDATYLEAKSEFVAAQSETRNIKDALEKLKGRAGEQQTAIDQEERHLAEVNGGVATQRLDERDQAQARVEQAKSDLRQHNDTKQEVAKAAKDKTEAIPPFKGELDEAQKRVNETMQAIGKLESRDVKYAPFKHNTRQLEDLIAKETRWHEKPIGPIGRHVRLLKPEWSSILECVFGGTLSGFLVFSKHDLNILSELKRKANCDAEGFTVTKQPIQPREPDEQFDTVLRALEIDNEYVEKLLIIQHSIEQHILIPDQIEASAAMYSHGRLRNVRICYSFNTKNKRQGVALKYSARGQASLDPVNEWNGPPRMRGDIEAHIAERRRALLQEQEILSDKKDVWQKARAEHVTADQAVVKHKRRADALKIAVQEAEDKLDEIESRIKDDQVESGKLQALQEGLRETNDNINLTEEQFKDAINASDEKKQVMRDRNSRSKDFDNRIQELKGEVDSAKEDHVENDKSREKILRDKNNAAGRVRDAESDRVNYVAQRTEAQTNCEKATKEVTDEFGGRVNIPEGATLERMKAKYHRLSEDHTRWQRQLGFTIEEAIKAAEDAEKAHDQAKKDYDNLNETKEMLQSSLNDRRARWEKFRQHISVRARVTFLALLSERGFRGALQINHKLHLLDLRIEPDISKKSATGRDARTLSGGEKSFSQICMLLAMWEAMGSPLRCLDEFDVFMDNVNRKQSVKLIIECARNSVGKQFILISPGAAADIERAPDVHVQELAPPERRGQQQTIEESNAAGQRRAGLGTTTTPAVSVAA